MRKKLNSEEKKVTVTITLSPIVYKAIESINNKSKFIEQVLRNHLVKNNILKDDDII